MADNLNKELIRNYLIFCCNRGPVLVDLLYTIIIWAGIAAFLTATGLRKPLGATLAVCESIGISLFVARRMLFFLFKPHRIISLVLTLMAVLVVGLFMGYQVGGFILRYLWSYTLKPNFFHMAVFFLVYLIAIIFVFLSKYRLKASREAIQQERIKRLSVEKEALEGNLRLLQAQIEPHFLFNTLSNILSLIDTEPGKGKSMLLDLIRYLRTSLSRTRPDTTTLDQETEAVKAYLNIQKIRLSDRLNFTIEVPETLAQYPFPPMLLQPLVENAVKHGLEPKIEGGEIRITAVEEGESIRIEVADTGLGFSSFNVSGVGIANVKERIKLIYGEKGRLLLEENKPDGVRAIIEVPKGDL